jgi:uncharacterized protein YdaU (DUF1376 family)
MPWYIADYLADTAHLRAAQSGAYLHLIMHYWQHGGVPDDNSQLAAIARMTGSEWKKARPIIEPFFQMPGWKHKRVEEEIAKADAKYELRAAAGKAGGEAKAKAKQKPSIATPELEQAVGKTEAKSYQLQPQPQPQPQKELRDGTREADPKPAEPKKKGLISEEAFELSTEVLALMGLDLHHPRAVGSPFTVQGWLNARWPREVIVAGVQTVMIRRPNDPPDNLKYFEKAIARAHAELTRPKTTAPDDGWPADYQVQFWEKYPNKVGKADALKKLDRARSNGVKWDVLMTGLDAYNAKTDDRPWCNPATWIFQCRWDDQPATVSPNHGKVKTGGSLIDAIDAELARSIEEDHRFAGYENPVLLLPN